MSKFDRHKKKEEIYIFPHAHCEKCGVMIEEAYKYCSDCYEKMNQKKKRKLFRFKRHKNSQN